MRSGSIKAVALGVALGTLGLGGLGCGDDGGGSLPASDQSTLRSDVIASDTHVADSGSALADAAGDAGPPREDSGEPSADGGLAADSTTPTGCNLYSNWSCKVGQGALLCITRCGPDELTCTNGGVCQCGIGLGPCKGTFSASTPCDVCRKAWLAGCCK